MRKREDWVSSGLEKEGGRECGKDGRMKRRKDRERGRDDRG